MVRAWGAGLGVFLAQHIALRRPTAAQAAGRVLRATLRDADGAAIDDILITVHAPAPDWDVRLHLHGSPWVVQRCRELLIAGGLNAATPDDDASLWPADSQVAADANRLLPTMSTLAGARWLLEQVALVAGALRELGALPSLGAARQRCEALLAAARAYDWYATPLRVALVGPPNAGKSTLANALSDRPASLVSDVPGTTRDWIEIPGELEGFPVTWIDTAGLRAAGDELEAEGIRRTRRLIAESDAVVVVLDARPAAATDFRAFVDEYATLRPACVVLNKADAAPAEATLVSTLPVEWQQCALAVSALGRTGLDDLMRALCNRLGRRADVLVRPAAFSPRLQAHLAEARHAADLEELRRVVANAF